MYCLWSSNICCYQIAIQLPSHIYQHAYVKYVPRQVLVLSMYDVGIRRQQNHLQSPMLQQTMPNNIDASIPAVQWEVSSHHQHLLESRRVLRRFSPPLRWHGMSARLLSTFKSTTTYANVIDPIYTAELAVPHRHLATAAVGCPLRRQNVKALFRF